MRNKFLLSIFIILIAIINTGCFSNKNSDFDKYFSEISQNTKNFFNFSDKKTDNNKKEKITKEKEEKSSKINEEIDKKYCAVCGLELNGNSKMSDGQNLCENCWNNKNIGFKPFNNIETNNIENSNSDINNDNNIDDEESKDDNDNDNEEEHVIPPPQYSDPTLCCLCGNQLERYWTANDLKYCPDCYEKYIVEKCARCNTKLGQYYKVKKKKYCPNCYDNYIVERCARCNNKLGQYYKVKKQKYCPDCYDNYIVERCYYCNKKLEKYYNGNYGKVCKDCYIAYEVPKCIVCHNPIMEKYYIFPTGKCCEPCFKEHPHCFNCGLPTEFPAFRDDDFILCSTCNQDKITTRNDLDKLYEKVKLYVKKSCGISVDLPSENIILLSSNDLKERTKNVSYLSGHRALGYCYTTYALSNLYNQRNHTIYIQNGMPYNLAFKTLAHEYGHAWDHQNTDLEVMKRTKDHAFSEGFAEWVSYNTMKEYGIKDKVEQMTNTPEKDLDPIYGIGFKKMLKLEENLSSKHAVLEYVKNHNDFKD